MKLPISWLKKYIAVNVSPEKLAEMLTMSGAAVDRIENKNGEAILAIEVTTNRPDCLSILGLAQEVSALTGKKIQFPKILCRGVLNTPQSKFIPKVIIEDKKGCPKYTACLIQNVTIKPSPIEIQKNLGLMDTRAINNAVDATNFVLFEMGQPLHAFDADKIKGGTVIVRRAKAGEKFLGLDGLEYTLDEKILVIADAEKPIAIAGVMGGKLTEVTASTKNILLESAYFDPALVRQTSRRLKLGTESSYRFERGVNPENVEPASARARDLIVEWGGGAQLITTPRRGVLNTPRNLSIVGRIQYAPTQITLSTHDVERMLGTHIPKNRISAILKSLGFGVKPSKNEAFSITVPSSRRDVTGPADLVEEILRIEGFDKIPVSIPDTRYSENPVRDEKAAKIPELKKLIAAMGFQEIITTSFLSEKSLKNSGFEDLTRAQRIKNPVSAEQEFLRPSLLPGMLGAMLFNLHRKASSLKFFEIGNRYLDGREETVLALGLTGHFEENWQRKSPATFFDLKGALENVGRFLKCPGIEKSAQSLDPVVLHKSDILKEVFYAEIVLENFASAPVRVKPIPKFPQARRDIAFVIDEKILVKELEGLMQKAGAPYLREVTLFDQFVGKNIPSHKRSLAFSLSYQKEDGTFTDEEIQGFQARIGEALKNQYQVEFR